MDIYDPQTLGIMVFGGFMVISAVGIALVSTFSMKETSYEEALAKQRRELGKTQSVRTEKKKKDKVSEKKNRGKKKDEKPNGKIPEQEKAEDVSEGDADTDADIVSEGVTAPTVAPSVSVPVSTFEVAAEMQPKSAAEPNPAPEPSPAPSPKEKKRKQKVAKVEPASTQSSVVVSEPIKSSAASAVTQAPVSAPTKVTAPSSAPAPTQAAPASAKAAPPPASAKSTPPPASAKAAPPPASAKSTPPPASAKAAPPPASAKSTPPPASAKSTPPPASAKAAPPPASTKSAPAPTSTTAKSSSTKSSTSAAPASAKPAPVTSKSAPAPTKSVPAPSKTAPVLEAVTKDVPVMAVPPVGSQQAPSVAAKAQEPKKKASKKKTEPVAAVDSADAPLYLPYKALVSTISSMVFSEGEAHRLIEILSEKVGIIQDTWHKATQKGDPVAMLKKQLDEREKQLAAEQEDASAVKNRLRELTKELSAEKAKVASVETRLSSQLSKREQEMVALQARMQASYQDHVAQTQRLNAKILSLQDQLEKGPNAQLARLQQENSILRDALNQATSQAESKQNAELAKLRQECAKLTKELGEKTESVLADENIRKGLEAKVSAAEKELSQFQTSHAEKEQALQRKLEEVCEELRTTQSRNGSLQATLDKAQQDSGTLSEFQVHVKKLEAELKERCGQVDAFTVQLEETKKEKRQLEQQVASINSLLEASQNKKEEDNKQVNSEDVERLKISLQERESQLNVLHEELKQLQIKKEAAENTIAELEQRNKSEDASQVTALQDELKNLKEEMVTLKNTQQSDGSAELALLQNSLTEKDALVTSLQDELRVAKEKVATHANTAAELAAFQNETKEALQTLFPQIPVETEQLNWLKVFTQNAQGALSQESQSSTAHSELLEKLKEAEESHGSLQAECEQYRTVLAETEGMLKHLQKSVEEEELVWKSKMANSEEQLKEALQKVSKLEAENQSIEQLKEQMMLLEAQLEKQTDSHLISEEMEQLKLQLSECQSQLDLARKEAKAHKEELAQVREQLSEITLRAQQEQNGPAEAQPTQVQNELSQTAEKLHGEATHRQQLSEEYEKAQKTVAELQAQLDLLKDSSESPQSDTEDVAQLKERLAKEKKLSKDLGQAATKLQQLLKATREQLTKERETVRTLQEHLENKGEYVELKEGTSV
ncbi:ribosome-binding protein 1a isoform X3 [Haplochromis burtoni]|uniref:ribosome-binding protein 1a isoform X3 n=1 Tax=Haplochromis burtoni TaxID=8153 RepID=UPI0006C99839|nr:ribosome-binding protein 1a isoform X3 [Haplochromis burtoni]